MSEHRSFSLRRILTIAGGTYTQLLRMKVFYFLAPVAVVFIGLQFLDLPFYEGPEAASAEAELRYHKTVCLGTIMLFACLFAIVATAVVIPKDVEDRILYTILCKPVPRLEYLIGKFLGVAFVILVSVLVMNILMMVTLEVRTGRVLEEVSGVLLRSGLPIEEHQPFLDQVAKQGPSWELQAAVWAHLLKALVLGGVALVVSTFSSSTLFTVAISTMVWVIGAVQGVLRRDDGTSPEGAQKVLETAVTVLFPNLSSFEAVAEAGSRAEELTALDVGWITGLASLYLGIYLIISWFVISDKEF